MPAVAPILLSVMKVVAFDSNVAGEASLTAYVMPDSSLLLQGKPFFIPAFAESFEATFQLAFRIDRIGKTIAPRFAPRYIGAVAPAMAIKAVGMEPERLNGAFDGAAVVGQFVPIAEWDPAEPVSFSIDGERQCELAAASLAHSPAELVSFASSYFTFKMGDIVFSGSPFRPITLKPEMVITAMAREERLLKCKIK